MYPLSDQYGDLSLEDVEEFEGLQPDDEREIRPLGRFERQELRTFDEDFGRQLDYVLDYDHEPDDSELEEIGDDES